MIRKKIEQGERKWSGGTLLMGVLIDFVDKVTLSKDFKEVSLVNTGKRALEAERRTPAEQGGAVLGLAWSSRHVGGTGAE